MVISGQGTLLPAGVGWGKKTPTQGCHTPFNTALQCFPSSKIGVISFFLLGTFHGPEALVEKGGIMLSLVSAIKIYLVAHSSNTARAEK